MNAIENAIAQLCQQISVNTYQSDLITYKDGLRMLNLGDIEAIAQVTYEANRAFMRTKGQFDIVPWIAAGQGPRENEILKVRREIENPMSTLPVENANATQQSAIELFIAIVDQLA